MDISYGFTADGGLRLFKTYAEAHNASDGVREIEPFVTVYTVGLVDDQQRFAPFGHPGHQRVFQTEGAVKRHLKALGAYVHREKLHDTWTPHAVVQHFPLLQRLKITES